MCWQVPRWQRTFVTTGSKQCREQSYKAMLRRVFAPTKEWSFSQLVTLDIFFLSSASPGHVSFVVVGGIEKPRKACIFKLLFMCVLFGWNSSFFFSRFEKKWQCGASQVLFPVTICSRNGINKIINLYFGFDIRDGKSWHSSLRFSATQHLFIEIIAVVLLCLKRICGN